MSWPMQTPGQWNPGMAMAPDMNMGSYTPEQWAAMQQQNWQQWTQWQQQYAQWQSQYGERYAEQMQAMQTMGGMPPLPPPSAAPPPAPPPPDKPPPPPHENNQPLYAPKPSHPAPVPAPTNNQNRNVQPGNKTNLNQAGANNNWSYGQEPSLVSANAEALKKLAEEERLFDIQFQKWEEEIEKWKKDNVNHPDKQAYKEYEDKFESCRAQLLERRQQMNKKKARLLGTTPPPPPPQPATPPQGNGNTLVPPLLKNTPPPILNTPSNVYPNIQQNYGNNPGQTSVQQQNYAKNPVHSSVPQQSYGNHFVQQQNYSNNPGPTNIQRQNYANNSVQQQNYGNNPGQTNAQNQNYGSQKTNIQQPNYGLNVAQSNYKQGFDNNSIQVTKQHQQNYGNNSIQNINKQHQDYGMKTPQNNPEQGGSQYQYQHYMLQNQNSSKAVNNTNLGNQDKYDTKNEKYPSKDNLTIPPPNPSFLLASESNKKGIPGLDLVPDTEKSFSSNTNQDVIVITDDKPVTQSLTTGPDYSTISKGINNILGDEKIMNILSMVRGQVGTNSLNNQLHASNNLAGQIVSNSQTKLQYEQGCGGNQNQQFNQQYDNRQHNMPYNRQSGNYSMQQNREASPHGPQRFMDESLDDSQSQYKYDRNPQYGNEPAYDNGPPRGLSQGRSNIPGHQNENIYTGGPPHSDQQGVNDYPRGLTGPPERRPLHDSNINTVAPQTPLPKWIDEPMFSPSIIVEYEHKPLRLKARDFIEPVHMFEYNHKSKDEDNKRKEYEKETDDLFTRNLRKSDKDVDYSGQRYSRDFYYRNFERRTPRDDHHSEFRPRPAFRDECDDRRRLDDERRRLDDDRKRLEEDRRRLDNRFEDRRRDDRDKYNRREDLYRERDRDFHRDRVRGRESHREDIRHSRSHERDTRKRALSKDSDISDSFTKKLREKEPIPADQFDQPKHIVMIDDLLEPPGREMRPQKIVIILRGPPGSGKSYLAKLIRDKEAEHGGTVRIMSIDDYFMQEGEIEEKDPNTGKMIKKPTLKYEYDESSEETYINSLKRAFKRSLTDGYFSFIIYDAVNETLKSYADVWNLSRQNDFQVYICTMELDPHLCYKRNIHNRTLEDIEVICTRFYPTPAHHIQLDATTLLQSGAITEVQMEDADDEVIMEDAQESEVESVFTSKWEKMDDAAQLARLDGTSKPLRPSQLSMEDYLQLDDWKPTTAKPGKKTVRWADIEESRQQEKMRAIGFVVGQTDWNRMTDPTMGSSALTQTKYIERVRRH